MVKDHSQRAHAKLSASGSKRWLSCTPSARLEEGLTDEGSAYANEGTRAHEVAEIKLKQYLGLEISKAERLKVFDILGHPEQGAEMDHYTDSYRDAIIEIYHKALASTPDAVIMLEQRLDFSEWVPEGFGTGDVLILTDDILEVIDLKYGKGVKVDAEDNSQARLYGLGALNTYGALFDFKEVRMTIIQPRLDHISTESISVEDLLTWADEYVRPRAALADAGQGDFKTGDHCQFCKVKATCRARAEENLALAAYEFAEPALLGNEEVSKILEVASKLSAWAADIHAYALKQAENGVHFEGWKFVEGRSNRKYRDEDLVAATLSLEGYSEDKIYNKKLKGITDMEKILGKKAFTSILEGFIIKPQGAPTLVPESDKRDALNSLEQAGKDFE